MKQLLLFISAVLLFSCQREFDYDLPVAEEKIVMEARINSGDTIAALINISTPILSPTPPNLEVEADVYLYENNIPVDTLERITPFLGYPNELTNYKSKHLAQVGRNYRLEVETAEHGMAYGKNTIPEKPEISLLQIDTEKDVVYFRIKDNPNTKDYYLIDFRWDSEQETRVIYQRTDDPTVEILYGTNDIFTDLDFRTGYISVLNDDTFNGKIKNVSVGYFADEDLAQTTKVRLIIKHITHDFYQHELSKAAQLGADETILASPASLHSNVTNGYGVVIGSADSTVIFTP